MSMIVNLKMNHSNLHHQNYRDNTRMNIFVRYFNYLKTWRLHRDAIKQLNKLSDRELRDIGMNRNDIDRLVWLEEDKDASGRETK